MSTPLSRTNLESQIFSYIQRCVDHSTSVLEASEKIAEMIEAEKLKAVQQFIEVSKTKTIKVNRPFSAGGTVNESLFDAVSVQSLQQQLDTLELNSKE